VSAIIDTLQLDKKVKSGQVRFVLPSQIGQVEVTDQVRPEIIRKVLKQM
jgi:3-dehydroquinate synthase